MAEPTATTTDDPSRFTPLALLVLLGVVVVAGAAVLLLLLGGDDDGTPGPDEVALRDEGVLVVTTDLAGVCTGEGAGDAVPGYDDGADRLHPVAPLLVADDGSVSARGADEGLPPQWVTSLGAPEQAELVACVRLTGARDAGGACDVPGGRAQPQDATYAVEVRRARDADVLTTATVEARAEGCPGRDGVVVSLDDPPVLDVPAALPAEAYQDVLRPFVEG